MDLKVHLSSAIFDARKGACYLMADIINYYLNNPMAKFQYMRIHFKDIPHKEVVEYSLLSIVDTSGYVYIKIRKGMYGRK